MLLICLTSANTYRVNTDADLLDEYLAGIAQKESAALSDLYTATSACVYGYILSILKNTYDAEDVLQECFLSIYASASGYRSSGKPMAWILTIAKNLCLQKIREQKKETVISSEDYNYCFDDNESMTPEDKLVLQACMKLLSDEERQIVLLHAVAGWKHREIAEWMSLSLSAVLSKYNRALKKLKAYMKERSADE